ncbi:MAG TPA: YkgJ family cysteine cluster protein [Candidatus Lokiarchaeia archaeon]|nr:YkgJ family cysteine cluster protein [Candidatus Lokiarchaeia archaeon]
MEQRDVNSFTSSPPLTDNPDYCVQHCSGFCCSEYTVLITAQDAKRILENIPPLHPYQFLTFYDQSVETLDFYPIIKIKGKGQVLGMIQDEKRKTCPFHTALGLCGIHNFSPMVCQTYPFTMTDDHELTYVGKVKCGALFPPYSEERAMANVLKAWEEVDQYKTMVDEWNAAHGEDGSFEEFLIFTGILKPEQVGDMEFVEPEDE